MKKHTNKILQNLSIITHVDNIFLLNSYPTKKNSIYLQLVLLSSNNNSDKLTKKLIETISHQKNNLLTENYYINSIGML